MVNVGRKQGLDDFLVSETVKGTNLNPTVESRAIGHSIIGFLMNENTYPASLLAAFSTGGRGFASVYHHGVVSRGTLVVLQCSRSSIQ